MMPCGFARYFNLFDNVVKTLLKLDGQRKKCYLCGSKESLVE